MTKLNKVISIGIVVAAAATSLMLTRASEDDSQPAVENAALTVTATHAQQSSLPIHIDAVGDMVAWQEASIGTEVDGMRLTAVTVNVGDEVKRGQILASFDAQSAHADFAEAQANAEEAAAALAEAQSSAQRALTLNDTGAMSAQQINQYVTAERAARARSNAALARQERQRLRLAHTHVRAPDDGLVSSRSATVGAVTPAGQELFRLIRKGRLEWRAAVAADDLRKLSSGQIARITTGDRTIEGRLRIISPAIDTQTRNGLVYVDLSDTQHVRAGMFARGYFEIGQATALTLPQSAVQLRDGFNYVLRIGADSKVVLTKVSVGRRAGDRIEITGGLAATDPVVASGGTFLSDGDRVRLVEERGLDSGTTAPVPATTPLAGF